MNPQLHLKTPGIHFKLPFMHIKTMQFQLHTTTIHCQFVINIYKHNLTPNPTILPKMLPPPLTPPLLVSSHVWKVTSYIWSNPLYRVHYTVVACEQMDSPFTFAFIKAGISIHLSIISKGTIIVKNKIK